MTVNWQTWQFLDEQTLKVRPKTVVSHCLLGAKVRYDGQDKRHDWVSDYLSTELNLIPLCPETAIGLGTPRPPVHLVQNADVIHAVGRDDSTVDITKALTQFAAARIQSWQQEQLCAAILKSRSPSCGVANTPIYGKDKTLVNEHGYGLWSEACLNHSAIALCSETLLTHQANCDRFVFICRTLHELLYSNHELDDFRSHYHVWMKVLPEATPQMLSNALNKVVFAKTWWPALLSYLFAEIKD